MDELTINVLAGIGTLLVGMIAGALLHRSFQGEAQKNKRLEQKLSELQDTYTKYQAQVSAHFMETAQKVHTLNKSYREVHAQLAKGASQLCNDEHKEEFLALNFTTERDKPNNANNLLSEDDVYSPPMDYAPKETPDEHGTLSPRFGLKDAKQQNETDDDDQPMSNLTPPRI